jgi:hypothetical protein
MLRLFGVPSSILLNVKTVQMFDTNVWIEQLCEVFFSLFERLWGCALSWSLTTPNLKPIGNSGKFLREGHIHTKDSVILVPLHFFIASNFKIFRPQKFGTLGTLSWKKSLNNMLLTNKIIYYVQKTLLVLNENENLKCPELSCLTVIKHNVNVQC